MTRALALLLLAVLLAACESQSPPFEHLSTGRDPHTAPANLTGSDLALATTTSAPPRVTARRASRSRPRSVPAVPAGAPSEWRSLVLSLPWDAGTALRIIQCESGGNPNAYNRSSGATGLFQILHGPFDPIANVRLAFSMWSSRGWQPWATSASCW